VFFKHLSVFTVVLAIGVASCSGPPGTTVQDPLPHGTGLTTSGTAVTGTGVSGITSTVTIAGSGNVNAAESSTSPNSLPVIQSSARASGTTAQSVKPAATTPNTALVYLTLTASATASISGFPASSFTFANAPIGSVYLAYYNGSAWVTIGSAGTVSGSTVTFGAVTFSPTIPLAAGASMYIAVYSGSVIVAPTPSPSPTATATATASPTASPSGSASSSPTPTATPTTQAIVNGTFETGSLSPWYPCFASHTGSGPVDDNLPIPPNEDATPIPANSPTPAATTSPDLAGIVIATSVPAVGGGTGAVHGGTYAALVGHPYGLPSPTALKPWRGKGNSGICQDLTLPAFNASLSLYVFEGGNYSSLYSNDVEAEIYPAGSFTTAHGAMESTATPTQFLFLEDNCFDAVPFPTSFAPPMGDCTAPSGVAVQGGVWKKKGPYNLTTLAGTSVTLFMGIMGSSTSATFYGYAYFDDVSLTGTTTASNSRGVPQLNLRR
jgi:hypothetical protein